MHIHQMFQITLLHRYFLFKFQKFQNFKFQKSLQGVGKMDCFLT